MDFLYLLDLDEFIHELHANMVISMLYTSHSIESVLVGAPFARRILTLNKLPSDGTLLDFIVHSHKTNYKGNSRFTSDLTEKKLASMSLCDLPILHKMGMDWHTMMRISIDTYNLVCTAFLIEAHEDKYHSLVMYTINSYDMKKVKMVLEAGDKRDVKIQAIHRAMSYDRDDVFSLLYDRCKNSDIHGLLTLAIAFNSIRCISKMISMDVGLTVCGVLYSISRTDATGVFGALLLLYRNEAHNNREKIIRHLIRNDRHSYLLLFLNTICRDMVSQELLDVVVQSVTMSKGQGGLLGCAIRTGSLSVVGEAIRLGCRVEDSHPGIAKQIGNPDILAYVESCRRYMFHEIVDFSPTISGIDHSVYPRCIVEYDGDIAALPQATRAVIVLRDTDIVLPPCSKPIRQTLPSKVSRKNTHPRNNGKRMATADYKRLRSRTVNCRRG